MKLRFPAFRDRVCLPGYEGDTFGNWAQVLRVGGRGLSGGSSLAEVLGYAQNARTMESARAEIQAFYEEHGRRPRERDLPALQMWLWKRGSSLRKLCDILGLLGGRVMDRSEKKIEEEVLAFFKSNKCRPGVTDMRKQDDWLRSHRGSCLRKFCDGLSLPSVRVYDHSVENIAAKIREAFNITGTCPKQEDFPNEAKWLSSNTDKTWRSLCEELGLYDKMTLEKARQLFQGFYDEHGFRPVPADRRDFKNLDQWLRRNGLGSVKTVCDDMRLPARNGAKREELSEEFLIAACVKYRDTKGKWPPATDESAEPFLGLEMTWRAVHLSVSEGFRGMPGDMSLVQILEAHPRSLQKCEECHDDFRSSDDSRLYCGRQCASRARARAYYYAKKGSSTRRPIMDNKNKKRSEAAKKANKTRGAKGRSAAAKKAAKTRKANAKKRSEAARKANKTRGAKGRSAAAKKAAKTRKANAA